MFTGLIKDIGTITSIKSNAEGREFIIETKNLINDIAIDDSVATNGVCLTATKIENNSFHAQAVHVTLEKTTLGALKIGSKVNLELALRAMDRMGGHIVQGHVNGVGKISRIISHSKNIEIYFSAPKELFKYIIKEGSIAIDGTSLTIAQRTQNEFGVSIIPHTYDNTVLHSKKIGDSVNIEVDIMAKYLENFVKFDKSDENLLTLLGK